VIPPESAPKTKIAEGYVASLPIPPLVEAQTLQIREVETETEPDRSQVKETSARLSAAMEFQRARAETPPRVARLAETSPEPQAGRYYQNIITLAPGVHDADGEGAPNVHGSRDRDFKAVVGGVSNVEPLTGQFDANSIAEMTVISAGLEEAWNAEGYRSVDENPFLAVTENPLSTFSIDVDTASYSNIRRFLTVGQLPPPDAVRIEEMVNYFDYDYPAPVGDAPFSTDVEVVDCPWNPKHRLARIGIKGREIQRGENAGSNLVFLIDVSGSMNDPSKLPLLKSALVLLVEQLTSRDQVSIVVYAGSSGLVLPSTSGDAKTEILDALDRLRAGGSTNGGAGLQLAYRVARENFIPGGVNRVILATDGDFNVGVTSHGALLRSIEKDAKEGIFLTALGFGYGNYQDDRLEHLADKGNGNYAYIDRLKEARKVLVEELSGTLFTIAKDVKIQVEFNPREVGAYRLIGYENRMLKKEDFNDDRKDAGEIGAGHTVTALYELVPAGEALDLPDVDELLYQTAIGASEEADNGELFTLKLRYKEPDGDQSRLLTFPVADQGRRIEAASEDLRFAAAVAQFGLLLRESEYKGDASFGSVTELALEGAGPDKQGYRTEFFELVRRAEALVVQSSVAD
jgi:Ca-activated chloride channel family protein